MKNNKKIIIAFSICTFLISWLILATVESIFGAPEALAAFIVSLFGSTGLIFIGYSGFVSAHPKRIFYLVFWLIPIIFFGNITAGVVYFLTGLFSRESFSIYKLLPILMFSYSTALFFIAALALVSILYFLNRRKPLEETPDNSGHIPYLFCRVIVWFFGLLSIVLAFLAVRSGPEECAGSPEFAGFGMALLGAGAILAFLLTLPGMLFIGIKHRYLTKSANASNLVLLFGNVLVLSFMFAAAQNPALACPKAVVSDNSRRDQWGILCLNDVREKMFELYQQEGNYNNFSWESKELKMIKSRYYYGNGLIYSYTPPTLVHSASDNSQSACLYLLLKEKDGWIRKKYRWYCADSSNQKGYTLIDPGSNGYCVPGGKALCPAVQDK